MRMGVACEDTQLKLADQAGAQGAIASDQDNGTW